MIIIRNDLKWLKFLLTCFELLLLSNLCHCSLFTENRICTSISHTHYYLKMGDVAIVSHGGESETPDAANNASLPAPDRCYVKFLTCHSCHLAISADYLEMAPCAENNSFSCDHIVIREPEYESSLVEFYSTLSNTSKIYESQTKILYIEYFSMSFSSNFSLTVKSLRNAYEIKGHTLSYRWNYTGTIQSPHFPLPYPSDYSVEYLIKNLDKKGFVQLIFSDFILSPYSFVEIYDSNGTKIDFYNGNSFRPPVITSSGPNLTVNFKANDESPNIGFRANYFFIGFYGKHLIYPPISDCGGFVEDHGGTITLTNMAAYDSQQAYDCVWIIRPRVFGHDTHLAVKVIQFEHMEPGSTLRIHEGLTSQSYLLETISSNRSRMGATHSLEYVVHIATGFYVRLQGYFTNESKIAIVYSAFRYDTCIPVKDFQCRNGRCIKPILHCDAYPHCGDGSDEISCFGHAGTISPEDAIWWRTLTPNYYFPKQESSGGAGTNTLILITSLAGLGMFILTTALILVKLHKQKREDAINREVLSSISADIDSSSSSLRSNFGTPTEPPVYDPPPSYEDVVKYYFPPPPTYTSAVSVSQSGVTQGSNNVQRFHSGVENAAFIPDNQNAASHQANSATQRMFLSPSLLTVILPASRLLGLNSNRESSNSMENGTANNVPRAGRSRIKEDKQSSHKDVEEVKDLNSNSSHSSTAESINLMVVDEELVKDTVKNELPLPSYESACNVTSTDQNNLSCTCIGACACSVTNESDLVCNENGNHSSANVKLPPMLEDCGTPTTSEATTIDVKEGNSNEDFRFSSNCEDEDHILHL